MRRIFGQLYVQVLIAVVVGVIIGHLWPHVGVAMKPFGDGFIKLIKMIITPIVFFTVVVGIAGLSNIKNFGKIGALSLIYFQVVTTLALVVGLFAVNLARPGAGMNIDPTTLDTSQITGYVNADKRYTSATEFFLNIIPSNPVDAFAKGEILQVLFFAILFGVALNALGPKKAIILDFISTSLDVFFKIVGYIMYLAPLGALGAIAFTVGQYGLATLWSLGKLVATYYVTCLVFVTVVFGLISRLHGFSLLRLVMYLRDELVIVLGTSSSESALPRVLQKLERLGAERSVVGLVVPIGYSFNLAGNALYFTLASIFLAQATNTPISLGQQVLLVGVLTLTSKGAAGVTGGAFIILAASLSAVGNIPVAGLALILGVNRFLSEAGSLTNTIGNAVAALVIAKWCKALNVPVLASELARGSVRDNASLGDAEIQMRKHA